MNICKLCILEILSPLLAITFSWIYCWYYWLQSIDFGLITHLRYIVFG